MMFSCAAVGRKARAAFMLQQIDFQGIAIPGIPLETYLCRLSNEFSENSLTLDKIDESPIKIASYRAAHGENREPTARGKHKSYRKTKAILYIKLALSAAANCRFGMVSDRCQGIRRF